MMLEFLEFWCNWSRRTYNKFWPTPGFVEELLMITRQLWS